MAGQFKEKFGKAGFQSVILGKTFSFEVESEEFLQVLHDGHGHWLTISTVGAPPANILVYDSMYASARQATKTQAACMMMVAEPNLTLNFLDVQMQAGGSDCGVFVLAFATAICCSFKFLPIFLKMLRSKVMAYLEQLRRPSAFFPSK